jgi:arginase family enzyme
VDGSVNVIGFLCRTSDRTPAGARGVAALAPLIAEHAGTTARWIGSPGEPAELDWSEDLRASRGCLLEAGGQVDDALVAGRFPVLLAGDCSICITTLPTVMRHAPEATVLWLDAHGDFNTPDTTPSGFLGGMCLAAACGRWDAGLHDGRIDPTTVVMCGVRDLDGRERVLLETAGVRNVRPSQLGDELDGRDVYVHLDLDVLDPSVLPSQFPSEGGLSDAGLRTLLGEVAGVARIVGVEITAFEAPEDEGERTALAETIATIVQPLLRGAVVGH